MPDQRPRSAFDVAAALSGGDPLAAAVAAGETPSPEMVAASGRKIGLSRAVAGLLLTGILAVLLATAWLFNPATERNAALENSPEVLAYTARGIMRQLGFRESPADSAHGFVLADDFLAWAIDPHQVILSKAQLGQERPGWVRFWYRESSEPLAPAFLHTIGPLYAVPGSRVTDKDPPTLRPEMRTIVLDPQGRLLEFQAVPSMEADPESPVFDWTPVLIQAGLNPQTLTSAQPENTSATDADQQQAWIGAWPGRPDVPLRVEAASRRGQPVFFKLFGPWSDGLQARKRIGLEILTAITIGVVFFGMVTCALLARRNIRAGRGDRGGALRIALYAFSTVMLAWLFGSDHTLDPRELNLYLSALGESLYWSAIAGFAYLALEPVVRHRWPDALISWNRVLKGRFRDPLVGRDVLVGIALAAGLSLSRTAGLLIGLSPPQLPEPNVLQAIHSNSHALSFLLGIAFDSVNVPLALFLLFSMFRLQLRNQWIAALVWICLVNGFVNLPDPELSGVIVATLFGVLWLLVVLQFGLVAGMAMWFADRLFRAEIMIAPNAWYSEQMYLLLGSVAVLAVYAFATSVRKHESSAVTGPAGLGL
jgi:serine/threonine-protein kinase